MKNIPIFLFCIFCSPLFAQVQIGMVREQNSNRRPVGGVQVTFSDAVPTTTDDNGNFRLVFQGKKAGDLIFFSEIKKAGYEIVNGKDLEILKVSSTERLGEDIILAKAGVLDAAKKKYYGVSDAALRAGFNKEKKALQAQIQQAKITQDKYEDQLTTLQEQYERQKASLDALAEQFARVNFDDVDALYREALELFEAGDIEGCKKKLEGADLIGRTDRRLQERRRIAGAAAEIAQQQADNEAGIQQDIKALKLQAQTYLLSFEFDKAEALYDQLLLLDSTNLEILQEAARFYETQHRYDKAKRTWRLVIAHPQSSEFQQADAYASIGELYTITGNLPEALEACTRYYRLYENMYEQNPSNTFYKRTFSVANDKLGNAYKALGDLDKALSFFERDNQLSKELYEYNPQDANIKSAYAVSCLRLGDLQVSNDVNSALAYYRQYNQLVRELHDAHPQKVDITSLLASSYERLGDAYQLLGNPDMAAAVFEQCNQLFKELYASNSQNVTFKHGLSVSYSKLGHLYEKTGQLDAALRFYELNYQIAKELSEDYPQNVFFKRSLAIASGNIGSAYQSLGNLDQSLTYFGRYNQLYRELCETDPQNMEFRGTLAHSYNTVGVMYMKLGRWDTALIYQEQCNRLYLELCEAVPSNIGFRGGLASTCAALGYIHMSLGNADKADYFYDQDIKQSKYLYEAAPQNRDFKYKLAIAYLRAGIFYRDKKGDKPKATESFQHCYQLCKELSEAYPTVSEYRNGVQWAQDALDSVK
ncbi:MAG: tetratricopeptide repeat protein [Lewinellaceae bacterium]|nr:tetratricopeptide repeat protein [Lewinellaceae bacterium]